MTKNSKGFVQLLLPAILVLLFVIGIGYYAYKNGQLNFTLNNPGLTNKDMLSGTTAPITKSSPFPTSSPTTSSRPNTRICDCSWGIAADTSVEFLVISPSGKQTGYLQTTNSYLQELPDSYYGIESGIGDDTGQGPPLHDVLMFGQNNPEEGLYKIQVVGKPGGKYKLDIGVAFGPERSFSVSGEGNLITNRVDEYTFSIPEGILKKM